MQTITIDILNNKALQLLIDLENLELIRVHKKNADSITNENIDWVRKNKGAMTKQTVEEIDSQLKKLRDEWR